MGYDMRWLRKADGEEAAVEAAREAFHTAVAVRDALPKDSRGKYTDEEWQAQRDGKASWDDLPANATPEYRAAQAEVDRTYKALNRADRSYFRLNIFGMSKVRDAMVELGAAYDDYSDDDKPKWPTVPDNFWEWTYGDYEAASDDERRVFERVQAHHQAVLDWAPGRTLQLDHTTGRLGLTGEPAKPGIPVHKLCSNDSWHVLPEEAFYAASVLKAVEPEQLDKALAEAGIVGDDWREYWGEWVQWLADASEHGGFEVR